jgi:glycosyltransferase involved in cell wall biosynthesis
VLKIKKLISKKSFIEIEIPHGTTCELKEYTHNFLIKPAHINLNKISNKYIYKRIWLGDFNVNYMGERIKINTGKNFYIESNGIKINNHNKIVITKALIPLPPEFIRLKLHNVGWWTIFNNFSKVISVCNYLKEISEKHTRGVNVAIPIPISDIDYKNTTEKSLKSPSVVIIQNHQLEEKSKALVQFAEVVKQLPKITFYISKGLTENQGTPGYKKVKKAFQRLKNVNFVEINSSNKYSYLKGADIYVLASGLDCTPATVLEAGLMKKPIVASKVGGVPEMIINGKTGWTVDNNNTKEWVEKIKYLIDNPLICKKMGENARKHTIKYYNVNKISKDVLQEII